MNLVAALISALLRKCVARLAASIGAASVTQHVDVPRFWHYCFGEVKVFPQILSRLLRVISLGAPVDATPGGNLHAELAYGNHPSAAVHPGTFHVKIARMSLMGVPWSRVCLPPMHSFKEIFPWES